MFKMDDVAPLYIAIHCSVELIYMAAISAGRGARFISFRDAKHLYKMFYET